MEKRKKLAIGLTAIGAAAMLPAAAVAQDQDGTAEKIVATDSVLAGTTVVLKVDGMVCPFCAYGLDKRLREIAAVDSVIVRLSDGFVLIREKEGHQASEATFQKTVTKAGFTLLEVNRIRSE